MTQKHPDRTLFSQKVTENIKKKKNKTAMVLWHRQNQGWRQNGKEKHNCQEDIPWVREWECLGKACLTGWIRTADKCPSMTHVPFLGIHTHTQRTHVFHFLWCYRVVQKVILLNLLFLKGNTKYMDTNWKYTAV